MKRNILFVGLVAAGLLLGGCSSKNPNSIELASPKVQTLIQKYQLEIVGFDYVQKAIGKGTRKAAKAILVDARPNAKYKKSTIPSSINIPDTKFDEYYGQLKDVKKDKEIIVFCGGWKCGKSPKLANMLKKKGFTNVKLYQAGEPQWIKKSYKEVDMTVVKAAQGKNTALIIDARPYKKYLQETIAGSISIHDTDMDKLKGRFPVNKDEKIIAFCGGYHCVKSHNVASKLVSLGYSDVSVYAAGLPAWKKAGLATTKSAGTVTKKVAKAGYSKSGLKLGPDEGTVDGEWFAKLIKDNKVPSYVQIVDVTAPDEYSLGHIKGSINIEAEKLSANALWAKLPKDKTLVFTCTAGGRSTDAWSKLNDAKYNVSEVYIFDANVDCKGNDCKIEPNEPIE